MRIDKQGGTRLLVLTRAIPAETVYMSTMDLSSLNVDVLLYLLKYVKPVDRFNLVLSGILKGFENVNKGIHLDERYCEHLTAT